jgi:hypothetical protein
MRNNISSDKWNLSKKWTYIRDMKKGPSSIKEYTQSLSQSGNTFLSKLIVVSVLVFSNLLVGLLFLLIYFVLR